MQILGRFCPWEVLRRLFLCDGVWSAGELAGAAVLPLFCLLLVSLGSTLVILKVLHNAVCSAREGKDTSAQQGCRVACGMRVLGRGAGMKSRPLEASEPIWEGF